jgi:hypothetical protein
MIQRPILFTTILNIILILIKVNKICKPKMPIYKNFQKLMRQSYYVSLKSIIIIKSIKIIFYSLADVLCCTASILNLCGISCDRYRAITTPLEYSAKTTPRRMLGIIFVVWLLSACVSLPPVLLLGNVHQDIHGAPFCLPSQNFW